MYKKIIGKKGEFICREYLVKKGYRIITQNFYTRKGEIDLIAYKNGLYIFVEVKCRKIYNSNFSVENAFSINKQRKFIQSVNYFLGKYNKNKKVDYRIDFAIVYLEKRKFIYYRNFEINKKLNYLIY